ncbi:unnamed protein product [Brachionus calyciflorus]|uniref:Uncharacterized protein n=1 Tax=Brachionus calyciflorus TaxID=104777 RepID=A0A814GBT5_9BILA|nr:unnamed protein product [Brachionus calyciflorus]
MERTTDIDSFELQAPLFEKLKSSKFYINKFKAEIESKSEVEELADKLLNFSFSDEILELIGKFEEMDNHFLGFHKTSKRPAFRGPKGGLFFICKSFQKRYFKDEKAVDKIGSHSETSRDENDEKKCKNEPIFIGTLKTKGLANGKQVFMGPRGGKFYFNSLGNKTYIANPETIENVKGSSDKREEEVSNESSSLKDKNCEKKNSIQKIIEDYENKNGYMFLGYHESKGTANGRPVFEGPNEGYITLNTIQKIKSEKVNKDKISNCFEIDSKSIKKAYDELYPAVQESRIKGFVQNIKSDPFGLLLLSNFQIKMWSIVQKNFPIWFFDATGCILKDIPGESKTILFSIVCHDVSKKTIVPLADFFTNNLGTRTISNFLSEIKELIERNIETRVENQFPKIVVLDFTWANINAFLETFNKVTIYQYLVWSKELIINANYKFDNEYLNRFPQSAFLQKSVKKFEEKWNHDKNRDFFREKGYYYKENESFIHLRNISSINEYFEKNNYMNRLEFFKKFLPKNGGFIAEKNISIVNTCSIDYFLLIIGYLSYNNKYFLRENNKQNNILELFINISAKITNGNWMEARLEWIHKINLKPKNVNNISIYNCMLSVFDSFYLDYSFVQQFYWFERCLNKFCKKNNHKKQISSIFKMVKRRTEIFLALDTQFLVMNKKRCQAVLGNKKICNYNLETSETQFLNGFPVLLIVINNFKEADLINIPREIILKQEKYTLVGVNLHKENHFIFLVFSDEIFYRADNLSRDYLPQMDSVEDWKITNIFYERL